MCSEKEKFTSSLSQSNLSGSNTDKVPQENNADKGFDKRRNTICGMQN